MIRRNQRGLNFINIVSDMVLNTAALYVAYWVRFVLMDDFAVHQSFERYFIIGIVNALIGTFIYALFHLYEPKRRTGYLDDVSIIIRCNLLNILSLGVLLYLTRFIDFSRMLLFFYYMLSTALIVTKHCTLRAVLAHYRSQGKNLKKVLLIGSGALARAYAKEIGDNPQLGYELFGVCANNTQIGDNVYVRGSVDELNSVLQRNAYDEAVIALDEKEAEFMRAVLDACNHEGVRYSIIPSFSKYIFSASSPVVETIGNVQLFNFCASPLDSMLNRIIKRTIDILASLAAIVVTSPVFLFAALGTKLTSKGPVIFKQERMGREKTTFNMYKFRSMRVNSEQDTAWSTKEDGRKTKFGQLLRKTSIDELPQLFNVLKGDMSLVGPRPEIPFHVNHFKDEIPYYMARHQVRPGITGWAQVNGFRGDTSITERIKHDLYYIYNWSFLFDIRVLIKTVFGGLISKAE